MNIVYIGQPFDVYSPPVQAGSIVIWNYQVARRIAREHQVTIYARQGIDQAPVETSEEITYQRVPIGYDDEIARGIRLAERLLGYPRPRRPSYASRLYFPTYIRRIGAQIAQAKPQVAHLFNFSQFVPVIRAASPSTKIVLHMHCEWLSQLNAQLIDKRLHHVDLVLGCSDHVTNKVRERFPHHAERCHTLYNGVDLSHFFAEPCTESANCNDGIQKQNSIQKQNGIVGINVGINVGFNAGSNPEENGHRGNDQQGTTQQTNGTRQIDGTRKELLFVGRISPEKGIHILLQAMNKVVTEVPQAHLNIVGTPGDLPYEYIVLLGQEKTVTDLATFYPGILRRGNYMETIQKMAEPLSQHVTFSGTIPHEQVIDYYRKATLLVNPSLSESFGMSLIEAMASDVPVVASCVGGMTDVVRHEENGLFVEPGNADRLAETIIDVLQNDEKRSALVQSGKASLTDRFSWDTIATRLLGLYDTLL